MLFQADAALIPFADKTFHTCVTSPPYWGLRKYTGEQERGMFPNLGLEPTPQEHIQHIVEIFREVKRVLRPDGVVWLNYADCHAGSGGENANAGLGSGDRSGLYRSNPRREKLPAGNLMLMPHRIVIALQEDGWIVRQVPIWWKTNPMPESPAGWRWVRHRIKLKGRKDANWKERPKGWQAGTGGHDSGSDSMGQYRDEEDQTVAIWEDCQGCEKCLHDNPTFPQLHVLKRGSWRHTSAHEYIFMLTKKMQYWCNQEAVRKAHSPKSFTVHTTPRKGEGVESKGEKFNLWLEQDGRGRQLNPSGRNPRSVLDIPQEALDAFYYWLDERTGIDLYEAIEMFNQEMTNPDGILDVPTAPYKGAHYATFPPNLIAPLIRASCPRRACPECGQGWSPVVEQSYFNDTTTDGRPAVGNYRKGGDQKTFASGERTRLISNVLAYRPTCECGHEDFVPGICLDPFIGSGTTGAVAKELQRRWAGLDISMEYLDEQAKIRALNLTPSKALDDLPLFNM